VPRTRTTRAPVGWALGLLEFMHKLIIILSTLLQLFYVWALLVLIISAINTISLLETGDPRLIAGTLSQGIVTALIKVIPGLIGLIISWRILIKKTNIPSWFKSYSKILSYLWLLFIPIGTVLGIIQLKNLKNET